MAHIAIFDMDGTLIDSGLDITLSINHVRRQRYSLEPLSVRTVVDIINAPSRNLAKMFYGTEAYEHEARALFEAHYYDQCIQNVSSYEGIGTLLENLKRQDFALGVATNAPSIFARRMLSHLELEPYFDLILGADNVDLPKPHPQIIQKHLDHHGYRSGTDHAWMIGDNTKDMDAAKNAGITGIFACWGFSSEGEGDYCAAEPLELLRIMNHKG
ncbi:MAG: HAD family hydrolase [Campylobacterales bacterium]|nr:HAD family hydrolase [Campylobacterales bacterium]